MRVGTVIVESTIFSTSVSGSRGAEDDGLGMANGFVSDAQSSAGVVVQPLGSGEAESAWNIIPMASSP